MAAQLSDTLLAKLSRFTAEHFGLSFPENRLPDLERGFLAACREFGFADAEACLPGLVEAPLSPAQEEILASALTVGETYFFREKAVFELLENRILPELIAARRAAGNKWLRLWSAGCSTGEEAYSLAIVVSRLLPDRADWNVSILGTDINARALRKAAAGLYRSWSLRHVPLWQQKQYLPKTAEGLYEVRPDIRAMVSFSCHNLLRDPYPAILTNTNALDVILCCNVLMYFPPETARQVGENFYRCLVDGGWLIVSPVEASPSLFPAFERVKFPAAVLFRRPELASLQPPPTTTPQAGWRAPPPPEVGQAVGRTAPPSPPPALREDSVSPPAGGRPTEVAAQPPADPGPHAMAMLHANRGSLAEALSWCDKAIAADPVDPRHRYLRACILQEQGRDQEAAESLKHSLYLDPDFVPAHLTLGHLLLRQDKRREAQRHFRLAYSLLRNYPQDEPLPDLEGFTAARLRYRLRELGLIGGQEDEA
ncbi:MAG: hypothetical protein H6R10_3670 [Rhodocyclaceae bacterium]|nr:hypothetical protein [Rhodocyclaceae bacterium]